MGSILKGPENFEEKFEAGGGIWLFVR